MSEVLREYNRLRAAGLGHFRALDAISAWLRVDHATARRVRQRAHRVEERGRGRA